MPKNRVKFAVIYFHPHLPGGACLLYNVHMHRLYANCFNFSRRTSQTPYRGFASGSHWGSPRSFGL